MTRVVDVCLNRDSHRQNLVCPRRGVENGNIFLIRGGRGERRNFFRSRKGAPYGGMRQGCFCHKLSGVRQMSR